MKKDTLYKLIIGMLLLVNVIQLSFSLINHKPMHHLHHGKHKMHQQIKETLNLSDDQFNDFEKLAKKHRKDMISLNKVQNKNAEEYFESPSDSLLIEINKIGNQKIIVTQNHFDEIKSLLNEDQKTHFQEFKSKALSHILR